MAESRTIETLERKRDEIARSIVAYEERIAQAQADLAHVNATIAILAAGNEGEATRPYVNIQGLFKRGEMVAMVKETLAWDWLPREVRDERLRHGCEEMMFQVYPIEPAPFQKG